jgi:hypothetical protein
VSELADCPAMQALERLWLNIAAHRDPVELASSHQQPLLVQCTVLLQLLGSQTQPATGQPQQQLC